MAQESADYSSAAQDQREHGRGGVGRGGIDNKSDELCCDLLAASAAAYVPTEGTRCQNIMARALAMQLQ